jgi:hypothetical protein
MLMASLALASSLIAGHWDGTMTAKNQPLAVSFDFQPGKGEFTSLTQNAMDYPLDRVAEQGHHVDLTLGGSIQFHGTIARDAISGTFEGGGPGGSFVLHRAAAPTLPYDTKDVTFRNGAVTLAGTLCIPKTPGRHAAVVLLHGSGPQSRWGTIRYLADRFARAGIAALAYDKRGSGDSGGDWRKSSYADLADDALAGVRLLAARPDIDPARIGLVGHSQGGAIAPLAATRMPRAIAFIVAEDTIAGPQNDQDLYRVHTALAELKLSPTEAATAMRVYADFVDAARGTKSIDAFEREADLHKKASWYGWMEFPPRDSWVWSWAKLNDNFDTLPLWRKVRVPVLLVYGEKDALVPVRESIAKIGGALDTSHTPHDAAIIPGAQHNLTIQPDDKGPFFWWHGAPGATEKVVNWVVTHTR